MRDHLLDPRYICRCIRIGVSENHFSLDKWVEMCFSVRRVLTILRVVSFSTRNVSKNTRNVSFSTRMFPLALPSPSPFWKKLCSQIFLGKLTLAASSSTPAFLQNFLKKKWKLDILKMSKIAKRRSRVFWKVRKTHFVGGTLAFS